MPDSNLDLEALRRLNTELPAVVIPADVWRVGRAMLPQLPAILAALERAEEVADQGCEFCENAVDDLGEERDGGREPHAHWWKCSECANRDAEMTSTIIGHLSDLLDRALERIPELERRMHGLEAERDSAEQGDQNATAIARQWRERAERVEAAARELEQCYGDRTLEIGPLKRLRAALAAAPAIDARAYHEPLSAAFRERAKVAELDEGDFEPDLDIPTEVHVDRLVEEVRRRRAAASAEEGDRTT